MAANQPITEAIYGAKDRPQKTREPRVFTDGFPIHRRLSEENIKQLAHTYPRLRKYLG